MIATLEPIVTRTPHVAESATPGILARIAEPSLNLCVWQRVPILAVAPAIRALLSGSSATALDLHAPSVERIVDSFPFSGAPGEVRRGVEALAADIADLAERFARIAEVAHPRVRLKRVEDDGCALFHADTLRVRLLCTYAGAGTQWLENSNARRDQLGSRDRTLDEATCAIVIDPARIRSVPAWHDAVFKGRAWPGAEGNALIHRSAPVSHRGEHRLRLCIDLSDACAC